MKKLFSVIIIILLKFLNGTLNLESVLTLLLSLDENEIKSTLDEISDKIKDRTHNINFKNVILKFVEIIILAVLTLHHKFIKTEGPSVTITNGPTTTTDDNVPSVTMDEEPSVTLN